MDAIPDILYQDESILAINKPAGLLSLPDGYDQSLSHVAGVLAAEFGKVWIVHRLDRETSGVMLLARNLAAHREINLQFEHRQIHKTYHALIVGQPEWDEFDTQAPLLVNGDRKHRTLVSKSNGKPAQTQFLVLQRFGAVTLIEARPHTGYTHQIRAHLASLGFPILRDSLYANFPGATNPHPSPIPRCETLARVALHAQSIVFAHPQNKLSMEISAPYPSDFQSTMLELQKI